MTLLLLRVFKFPSWSWPCTLSVFKANSLKGYHPWYHPQPRTWTVKIVSEKWSGSKCLHLFSLTNDWQFSSPSALAPGFDLLHLAESLHLCLTWVWGDLHSVLGGCIVFPLSWVPKKTRKILDTLQPLQSPQNCHWFGACATVWVFREVD